MFFTTRGFYEYQVMPYSLFNFPAVFQSFMKEIFRDTLDKYVIVYIDDILIHSQTREQHIQHVKTVLSWLLENQLYVKAEKCTFHTTATNYINFSVVAAPLPLILSGKQNKLQQTGAAQIALSALKISLPHPTSSSTPIQSYHL